MSNLVVFNQTIKAPQTQAYLASVLANKKDTFVTTLVSIVGNNTALQACEPLTIMYAALKATALDLPIDPNLGFAWVIPYKNKGKDEAQFQLGTKGLLQLAMRSGQFLNVNADEVYEGEISGIDRKTGDITLNGEKKSDKVVGYFAYFRLLNGFEKTIYMTKEDVTKHAQRFSKTFAFGPWKTDFDAMARKTVLKKLLSQYAPLSIDMQNAIKADQAVIRGEGDADMEYVDNQPQPDEQKDAQVDALHAKAKVIKARAKAAAAPEDIPAPGVDDIPAEAEGVNPDGTFAFDEQQ